MADERVQLVRAGYEAWNFGDQDWVLSMLSDDFEWVTPPDDPDFSSYKGPEQVVGFWTQWQEVFGRLRFVPEEIVEVGDAVVSRVQRHGTGSRSGVDIDDVVYQVFSFEGDTPVRCREFYDRESAMQAAGAGEAAPQAD